MVSQKEIAEKRKFKQEPKKFFTGAGEVTKEEFEREKRLTGTSKDPALARRAARPTEAETRIKEQPEEFGLKPQPQEQVQVAPEVQVPAPQVAAPGAAPEAQVQDQSFLENLQAALTGRPVEVGGRQIPTGLRGTAAQEQAGITPEVQAGTLPIAPVGALPSFFKVGTQTFANPQRAIQSANAVKLTSRVTPLVDGLRKWGGLALGALAVTGFSATRFLDKTSEQQQALNTLGEISSSIEANSISAAGDWREGLRELDNLESEILKLESDIKSGQISSEIIKIDGRILDVNADIFDQLAAIEDSRTAIRSFVLENRFPEMSPLEIQDQLRQLEDEGFLQPVDLTTARREIA